MRISHHERNYFTLSDHVDYVRRVCVNAARLSFREGEPYVHCKIASWNNGLAHSQSIRLTPNLTTVKLGF